MGRLWPKKMIGRFSSLCYKMIEGIIYSLCKLYRGVNTMNDKLKRYGKAVKKCKYCVPICDLDSPT